MSSRATSSFHSPDFGETQKLFRLLGKDFLHSKDVADADGMYVLLWAPNRVWNTFDSLIELWSWWLHEAARLINEGRLIDAFLAEYEASDRVRREEMIGWVIGLYERRGGEFARWSKHVERVEADRLGSNWIDELRAYLCGPQAGRNVESCLLELVAKRDTGVCDRLSKVAESWGFRPDLLLRPLRESE